MKIDSTTDKFRIVFYPWIRGRPGEGGWGGGGGGLCPLLFLEGGGVEWDTWYSGHVRGHVRFNVTGRVIRQSQRWRKFTEHWHQPILSRLIFIPIYLFLFILAGFFFFKTKLNSFIVTFTVGCFCYSAFWLIDLNWMNEWTRTELSFNCEPFLRSVAICSSSSRLLRSSRGGRMHQMAARYFQNFPDSKRRPDSVPPEEYWFFFLKHRSGRKFLFFLFFFLSRVPSFSMTVSPQTRPTSILWHRHGSFSTAVFDLFDFELCETP